MTTAHRVFIRMWAIAAVAHLAGNPYNGDVKPPSAVGFALLAVGLLAAIALVAPGRRVMQALCIAIPVSAALEVPILPNHWLLAAVISVGYLVSRGWPQFVGTAQGVTLAFYSFAAFAKLNTGFLDPSTSCAVYYANQSSAALGLGAIDPGHWAAVAVVAASAAIELSVVPLLLFRRTRRAGVMLAMVFHSLITLDFGQHFYDFTSVLLALFVLFLGPAFADRVTRHPVWWRSSVRRMTFQVVSFGVVMTTLMNVSPLTPLTLKVLSVTTFFWWIPYTLWVLVGAFGAVAVRRLTRPPIVGWLLVLLVVLNGLTPYTELKTAYSWNMYSNLRIVDGASNHLLVRASIPLVASHAGMVEIISSSDPGLNLYVDSGYVLPWRSFRSFASEVPNASVTYRLSGQTVSVERIDDDSVLSQTVPLWWRLGPLRSVRADGVAECQSAYLPGL